MGDSEYRVERCVVNFKSMTKQTDWGQMNDVRKVLLETNVKGALEAGHVCSPGAEVQEGCPGVITSARNPINPGVSQPLSSPFNVTPQRRSTFLHTLDEPTLMTVFAKQLIKSLVYRDISLWATK